MRRARDELFRLGHNRREAIDAVLLSVVALAFELPLLFVLAIRVLLGLALDDIIVADEFMVKLGSCADRGDIVRFELRSLMARLLMFVEVCVIEGLLRPSGGRGWRSGLTCDRVDRACLLSEAATHDLGRLPSLLVVDVVYPALLVVVGRTRLRLAVELMVRKVVDTKRFAVNQVRRLLHLLHSAHHRPMPGILLCLSRRLAGFFALLFVEHQHLVFHLHIMLAGAGRFFRPIHCLIAESLTLLYLLGSY